MNVEIIKPFTYKTGFVTGLLLLFSYMLGSCGTEANFDDPEELLTRYGSLTTFKPMKKMCFRERRMVNGFRILINT